MITPSQSEFSNIETGISVNQEAISSLRTSKIDDSILGAEQNYARAT
jgi:hypothetical protein